MNARIRLHAIAAGLALLALTGTAQAQTTLSLSSWVPPTHYLVKDILQPWMADVEKATEGRVKINLLPKAVGAPPQHWELARKGVAELERLFAGWIEQHYHRQIHSETGQTPIERFDAAVGDTPPVLPTTETIREAFLWAETRLVTKTATVSLHSNRYEVDSALVGRHVELVFDPFDLTQINVFYEDRPVGTAIPHVITRHTHPAARPEPEADRPNNEAPQIDYLGMLTDQANSELHQQIGGLPDIDW